MMIEKITDGGLCPPLIWNLDM